MLRTVLITLALAACGGGSSTAPAPVSNTMTEVAPPVSFAGIWDSATHKVELAADGSAFLTTKKRCDHRPNMGCSVGTSRGGTWSPHGSLTVGEDRYPLHLDAGLLVLGDHGTIVELSPQPTAGTQLGGKAWGTGAQRLELHADGTCRRGATPTEECRWTYEDGQLEFRTNAPGDRGNENHAWETVWFERDLAAIHMGLPFEEIVLPLAP